MPRIGSIFCICLVTVVSAVSAFGQSDPPQTTDADASTATPGRAGALPFITIDREAGTVDLQGKVVLRDAEWLELLACTPNTREHETIVSTPAKPSHIHFALLTLGLEPGKPHRSRYVDEQWIIDPPEGPEVEVFLLYELDGEQIERPANEWIVNQQTGEIMEGNRWLFAGSKFIEWEGQNVYMADANGTVLSLVNFGDDLLARPTRLTNETDNRVWSTRTAVIPEPETPVTIRLKPVRPVEND